MSGFEKTRRPERDYAAPSASKRESQIWDAGPADAPVENEARLWRLLDAARGVGAPVQRKSDGAVGASDPHAVASTGVASASERLPYHDQIQASFGRHDISHVRAQTGGSAVEASRALGASAYTIGDRVGFATSPDLHTAAHEAAHVVQQQGGVQLKGGIDGGAGDRYEQQADAVADKVVRGQSAESLLDATGSGTSSAVVQRKSEIPRGMVNARRYLSFNAIEARQAIINHLVQQRLPQPHPRMQWHDERPFYETLLRGFGAFYTSFEHPYEFAQAVFPGDPYGLVDSMRPLTKAVEDPKKGDDMAGGPVGPWQWSPAIGVALAQLVEQAVILSLYRLGPRWLEIAELAGSVTGNVLVDPGAIARSHPMDRFVLPAMCKPNVFNLVKDPSEKQKKPAKRNTKIGLRPVKLDWVGEQSKELWNWVRATPADATPEEVSAQLFDYKTADDHEQHADYYAAFLTAAPPMFGIPPQWAKTFKETERFRPDKIAAADSDPDHQVVQLGGSVAGDDQALLEIGGGHAETAKHKGTKAHPQPIGDHDNLVADAKAQATFLKAKLASWHLGGHADKTLAFLARRSQDGADSAKWVPVLTEQRDNLTTISTGILQLDAAVEQMKLKRTGNEAMPLREIMRFYADATATAHLSQTSKRMIQRAANAQSALTMQGLQGSIRDMDMSAEVMRQGVSPSDWDRNHVSNNVSGIDDEAVRMQTRLMRGEKVSGTELEDLQIRAEEASLEAKLTAVDFSLAQLEDAADEAGAGLAAWFASRFSSNFRNLKSATEAIRNRIADIRHDWQSAKRDADMPDDNGMDQTQKNLRAAVTNAKKSFQELSQIAHINAFLKEGASLVKWQQFRTACVKLAALIGISLVGGMVGGMAARGVAGMMMGTDGAVALETLSMGGQMVARGTGMVTETAISSVGQSVVFGDKLGASFVENLIMNLGSAGVLKLLGNKADEAVKLEKATEGFWKKAGAAGKIVLSESAAITGHTIMGIAMSYVAHRIVTGEGQPPPATLEEWMMQGAGIAVGRYVGHAIASRQAAQKRLAKIGFEPGDRLVRESEKVAELAKRTEQHPQAKDAMELLEKRHKLLTDEMEALEQLEKSPEKMRAAGLSKGDIKHGKAQLHAQLESIHAEGFGDVPLHLSGMQELIPGALWSGTPEQIGAAVHTAKESGISIEAHKDRQGGKWHLKVEGREIVVEERVGGFGNDAHAKTSSASHGETATKSGAGDERGKQTDTGAGRTLENAPAISERANAKLKTLAAPERAQIEQIFGHAENSGQHTLLERAFAAGHGPAELAELQTAMKGLSTAEVAKKFSGTGVVQFYEQSCVPTSYQIAIAEVDPYFAHQLRKNPQLVMQEQRDILIEKGAAQTKRKDVRKGKPVENLKEHLDDPAMGPRLKGEDHYSTKGEVGGVETTEMPGSTLHAQLEKATGSTYEVLTDHHAAYNKAGHGKYEGGSPPHQAIAAAVAAGKPVIVATRMGDVSHAQVIVGRTTSATGEAIYQIIDPYSGKMSEFPEAALDWFGAHSVSLPKEFADVAKLPPAPHISDPKGMKSGGPGEVKAASEFLEKLRASNAKAADELVAAGYKAESFSDTPHVLQFLNQGSEVTKSNQMKGFAGKTGLGVDGSLRLFDKLLQLHPTLNAGGLKKFGNATGEMAQQHAKLSCPVDFAISSAIDLSAHPRYAAEPAMAVSDLRGLITDNISPEVAMQELVRPSPFGDDFTSVKVAGPNKPAPDIQMETATGKKVGREMQVVGANVDTAANASPDVAKAQLENSLAKAIKDKAINYMRERTPEFDSQEIIIQIKPSKHGYNYDRLLDEAALFDRVVPRAFASTDYTDAVQNAKKRIANGAKDQPKVKTPDRIAIYDSTGKLKYSQ